MACVSGGAGAERGQRRREPRAGEAAARLTVRSWGCVAPPARWRFHVWRLDLDLEARARGRRRAAGGGGASGRDVTCDLRVFFLSDADKGPPSYRWEFRLSPQGTDYTNSTLSDSTVKIAARQPPRTSARGSRSARRLALYAHTQRGAHLKCTTAINSTRRRHASAKRRACSRGIRRPRVSLSSRANAGCLHK